MGCGFWEGGPRWARATMFLFELWAPGTGCTREPTEEASLEQCSSQDAQTHRRPTRERERERERETEREWINE